MLGRDELEKMSKRSKEEKEKVSKRSKEGKEKMSKRPKEENVKIMSREEKKKKSRWSEGVNAVLLQDILSSISSTTVVLKMDIEGYECKVT